MRIITFFFLTLAISLAQAQEVLFLDTYEDPEPGTGATTPVFTASPLIDGQTYRIVVEGTFSLAAPGDWIAPPPCGVTEPSATYPSPSGDMNGITGMDPFYFFALPDAFCGGLPTPPILVPQTVMSFDGGATFGVPPVSEPPPYNPLHVYTFDIQGQGQLAAFQYEDDFLPNNYGMIRITVTPVAAAPLSVPFMPLWALALSVLAVGFCGGSATNGVLRERRVKMFMRSPARDKLG